MKKKILIGLIIFVALAALSVGGILGYLKTKPAVSNLNNSVSVQQPADSLTVNSSTTKKDFALPEVDNTAGEIVVDWYDQPVAASLNQLFGNDLNPIIKRVESSKIFVENPGGYKNGWEVASIIVPRMVGVVKSGPFENSIVFLVEFNADGAGDRPRLLAINDFQHNRSIGLSKYYNYPDPYNFFIKNSEISITNLEPPSIISIPDSRLKFIKDNSNRSILFSEKQQPRPLFKYDDQNYIYRDTEDGCLFVKVPDGTIRQYHFDLDFLRPSGEYNSLKKVLDITWNNGEKNSYEYNSGNCFGDCYNYHHEYGVTINQLKKVGYLSGYPIYEPKSKDAIQIAIHIKDKIVKDSVLERFYKDISYRQEYQKEKVSLDTFLADHPVVYWQDPFGDFIELQNTKYIDLACGAKPVIYLYPQEKMDVSVKVSPNGGFSLTEPNYNDGWLVSASPNGQLYNYQNQKTYPYLFWEGYGLGYRQPQEGFVVAKAEVGGFLIDKLQQLGLVKNEYQEFIDFWLPKMQSANYYFITFVPQAEFDKLAPLQVLPRPDTIIRVFMDYEPLANYREVPPQKVVTPERKGFTVVEWGGNLHK